MKKLLPLCGNSSPAITEARSHERQTVPSGVSLAAETVDEESVGTKKTGRLTIGRRLTTCPTKPDDSGKCERGHDGVRV
jgi:hypothetical protein